MKKPIRILIVEDNANDADLAKHEICRVLQDCEFQVADTRESFITALETFQPDVILSDYALPQFDGMKALKLTLHHTPLTPLIIWTGSISEDVAVDCVKAGANNYILKDNLKRLGPAVIHALEEKDLLVARQQAEQKYQRIFDNSIEGIFQSSPEGRYLHVNPAMARIHKYDSPDEMIESVQNIATQIYVEPAKWSEFVSLLNSQSSVKDFESRNYCKDGSMIWTSTSARAVRDSGGRIQYYEGFVQDITQRKQVEDALRESQARYQNLVETSHDLIWSVDAEGQITFLNRAAREIYGCEPEELIGRSFTEVMGPGTDQSWEFEKIKESIGEANEFTGVESVVRHRDGRQIILSANSMVLRDENGEIAGIVGSSHDITARKQAEELLKEERNLLRTLIDNIPDRIYAMDRQGRKTLSNIADWQASGGKTMEDVLNKTDFDTYAPELAENFWKLGKAVLDSGQPVINYEEPGLDAEGNRVSILTTKIPLHDSLGNVIGLIGIGRDITEWKQTEERMNDLLAFNEEILTHSPMGILTYKFTGECVFANENAAVIAGTNVEQLKTLNFHTLESWKQSGFYDLVRRAIETLSPVTADIHHISTFGKEIWLTVHCTTFKLKGEDHLLIFLTDITERKQVEEKLTSSRRYLAEAQRVAKMGNWSWDVEKQTYYWSEETYQIFGVDKDGFNITDETFTGLVLPEDRPKIRQANLATLNEGKSFRVEYRISTPAGEIKTVSEIGYGVKDSSGKVVNIFGLAQDITERKQAETERQALLEILQGLADTKDLHELLKLVHSSIAKVIYAENFFVILHQEGTGLFEEIYSVDQYDPPAPPSKLENSITSYVFRSGKPLLLTRELFEDLAAQGEVKLIGTDSASWLGVPLKTSGRTIGVMAVQDYENDNRYSEREKEFLASIATQVGLVIERKQAEEALRESEEHYRTVFEGVQDAIFVESLDGRILMVNQRACEMFGYSQAEFLTKTVADLVPAGHPILLVNATDESLPEEPRETINQRANGELFPIEISGRLQIINGETVLLVVVRDITERKLAEEKIHRSAKETSALLQTSLALTHLDLEGTLQTIGNSANSLFLADGCRIFLMEPDQENLRCVLALKENMDAFSGLRIKIGQGVTGAVAASGQPEIVNEMHTDPRAVQVSGTEEEQEAIMFAPLKERDLTIGIISVRRVGGDRPFQPEDLELLEAFASMAASAVSKARLFEETQRRLSELHASEERFRQLADNIQEVFWMTDAETGRELYMSPAVETIWGRAVQQMLDEPDIFIDSVFPDDRPVLQDAIQREKRGEKMQLEYRILRPDGTQRWIWERAFPIVDKSGRVDRIAGISADITERKEAAEKLRESEDRYHSLFQNQLHGCALHEILTNEQGQPVDYIFLKVNPAFEKMTGLPADEIVGRRVTQIFPGIEHEKLIQIYGQVALTGEPAHLSEYVETLGKYYEINAYATGPRQFAVSFMDVTERRQAEQELRKLSRAVEQTGSTIVITDTAGNIEYVNPKFTYVTGYSSEEVIGRNPRLLQSGFTSREEYSQLWQTISSGRDWHGELLNKKKDGTLYWESVTISPIMNDSGEITHFVGVKEDITERKQNEIETRRHIAELEALYENGLSVGRLLEPHEIGNRVIETFARYLPWHHVTIRLRKGESDDLELVAFNPPALKAKKKLDTEQHFATHINKVGQGLSGWVIQTGTSLRTGNVHLHSQYIDIHESIQSGLYMPLKIGERVMGVISVESEAPDAFTEQDERLLATLANQTAIAFENARLYEAVQKELLERKRVEEALRISETHYRALADSITDILFELDQNLRYTHWNKASETLIGIPAQEAIGKPMEEIFGAIEEQARIRKIYEDVLSNHRSRTFETALRVSGEKRSFEINAYPSTRGVSVVAKDVTDRKRTEIIMQKRFELMEFSAKHSLRELMQRTVDEVSELTSSPLGFFHFMEEDQNHLGMQTWSTNALQLCQLPPEEGTHLPLVTAGVWADAVRQRRPLIQNDCESLMKNKDVPSGHIPVIREIVIPIIRNERIMAVMGISNKAQNYAPHDLEIAARMADYAWDIIERKQMEIALELERNQLVQRVEERTADLSRANSNLARALRVKDEFLANMSHELRTPLNAILGLSESLGEQIAGPLNDKQQKYISTISESGHHLLSLINDILDLAKIDAGQITMDINKVEIHSVCQASLRMVKQLAQKKNQEVSLEIDHGLGWMWADERRLKQMIVNLLGNAVKFTPENGKLGLEVQGDEEANQIFITVWDNGIGIKKEDLARLFQPFVQLDSGLAREATGTGLGLALVAQMARLHGGSVTATSEAGKGSRFTIILPWEPALAMDTVSRMRITGKFRAIKFDETHKPTILLMEDTKEVVMMLRDYLELSGYQVFTAQDGLDGLVQARHVKPDLILMDVQMPRMDGFETTRKLRSDSDFQYTPIIALTALAMPHDRERCLEAGMDEYISKPVNLKSLIKVIQSCLFEQESRAR